MPTRRTLILFGLAIVLYLLANQTQVGWVYLMSNLVLGLLLISFFLSMNMLRGLQGRRSWRNLTRPSAPSPATPWDSALAPLEVHEDDNIEITVQLSHTRLKPAFLISGEETCPFAPPDDQVQPLFAPYLFKNQTIRFCYQTEAYRRGAYQFPPLHLHSAGPFKLFKTHRRLDVPGQLLIYPAYHPLKRLRLLENRGFTDRLAIRTGHSSEVIGTREYRSGDSLRQIHWRSTARVGRLVVKEFSDNDQLTMTVVLDLSNPATEEQGKYSPFETALRLAASLGYYAAQQDLPFYLRADSPRWRPPARPLSWGGVLSYLARVENDGDRPLTETLRRLPPLPFVVALVSQPNPALNRELAALQRRGAQVLALVITPDSPEGGFSPNEENSPGLIIKQVTPHTWTTVLESL